MDPQLDRCARNERASKGDADALVLLSKEPTSAAEAATIIIEGVKADRLRILIGRDAHFIDRMVREDPDHAYDEEFFTRFAAEAGWYPGR